MRGPGTMAGWPWFGSIYPQISGSSAVAPPHQYIQYSHSRPGTRRN
jgi:hypothetical protein